MIQWPEGKQFAFTIFDDTDNSTVENIRPVYELLNDYGIKTTKSVWSYPSRDNFAGDCLKDNNYLQFIKQLQTQGFEIALHNIGSGEFSRQEIQEGFELFKKSLGQYPRLHANHAGNIDSIYWGFEKRFVAPLKWLGILKNEHFLGDEQNSTCFWGDLCKQHIQYIRNHTFNGINTAKYDKKMPYTEKKKNQYSNYWFSSSDGHTVKEFNQLIQPANLDQLEKEKGFCIVYTHFASGFYDRHHQLNTQFENQIKQLATRNAWFVPVGTLLDYLMLERNRGITSSYWHHLSMDMKWIFERIIKKIKFGR